LIQKNLDLIFKSSVNNTKTLVFTWRSLALFLQNKRKKSGRGKMKKTDLLNDEFIACDQKPLIEKVIYQYADIDSNGVVNLNAVCECARSGKLFIVNKPLPFSNFYVDRNYFDVIVADPVLRAHYFLYNIYFIEDGFIYAAGITSKFGFENMQPKAYKTSMGTFLNFDWKFDASKNDFTYNMNGVYSVRFNPNYYSQIRSFENLEKLSESHNTELADLVTPYDRPENHMQRSFFIEGARSVMKYGLNFDSYQKMLSHINSEGRHECSKNIPRCYFAFEQFYLSGFMAALNFYKIK